MSTGVVYIGIGNSDDKLSQREWACFQIDVRDALRQRDAHLIGEWHSYPDSIFQNGCYAIDTDGAAVDELKGDLAALATIYKQDAIAWAEAPTTLMLGQKPQPE